VTTPVHQWAVPRKNRRSRGCGTPAVPPLFLPGSGPDPTDSADYRDHLTSRQLSPEKRLLRAVLEEAVHDLVTSQARVRTHQRVRAYRDALAWLDDRDPSWPYSFIAICEVFDLDPEAVRRAVHAQLRHVRH
jgi:hypothetical protein